MPRTVKNLKELITERSTTAVVKFGKHNGKTIGQLPEEYMDWARKAVAEEQIKKKLTKEKDLPEKLHGIYLECLSRATGAEVQIEWDTLSPDQKKTWKLFTDRVKNL